MSQPNQPKPPAATNPAVGVTPPHLVEATPAPKPSRRQRALTFVKTHKQNITTGVLLTGLVGGSAYLGRKTANASVVFHEPMEVVTHDYDVEPAVLAAPEQDETA